VSSSGTESTIEPSRDPMAARSGFTTAKESPRAANEMAETTAKTPRATNRGDEENTPLGSEKQQRATRQHLKLWYELLPWIQAHMKEIIGEGTTGGVNFLPTAKDPRPIIHVFASRVDTATTGEFLKQKIANDERLRGRFDVEVRQGSVTRSNPRMSSPFQRHPTCGADIGIHGRSELQAVSQTFGGYICFEFDGFYETYGLACHHLLQDRSSSHAENEGVQNGLLNGCQFDVCQPSFARATAFDQQRVNIQPSQHEGVQNGLLDGCQFDVCQPSFARATAFDQQRVNIQPSQRTRIQKFGSVVWSSGYRTKTYKGISQLEQLPHGHTVCGAAPQISHGQVITWPLRSIGP
jgi:hypothetical protein